ncbi:MAG: phage tail protein [Azoarcus sp.]|jgi:hypothetical protein|nr:phage tail protein [Azoarcus sp.]
MGSAKKVTIGYRYYMTLFMGLCRGPVNKLLKIVAAGKTVWSGARSTTGQWSINQPNLFGGEKKEGGISGACFLSMGDQATTPGMFTAYLGGSGTDQFYAGGGLAAESLVLVQPGGSYTPPDPVAKNIPAFRDVVTVLYHGLISAMTPYVKPWEFQVERTTAGWDRAVWYPETATIDLGSFNAANPAHIIYEALTNRDWGGGVDPSLIDDAAFRAFADICYSEGFGLCLRWNRSGTVGNLVETIVDHIGAVYFLSPRTGLHAVVALRGNYDAATLPLYDENSGLLGVVEDENTSLMGGTNEVIVKWTSPVDGEPRESRERNLGMISASGQIVSDVLEFPAIPSASLAARVAARELVARGGGIKKVTVRLDRRGYVIQPGDVFRISSTRRGIENMVLRAIKIDDGTLSDAAITVTCIIDVFGLPQTTYADIPKSDWVPPDMSAHPVAMRKVYEPTWRDIVLNTDAANLELVDPGSARVGVLAAKPSSAAMSFVPATRIGGGSWVIGGNPADFASCWLAISNAIAIGSAPVTLNLRAFSGSTANLVVGAGIMIDDEVLRVTAVDLGNAQLTAARGCVDTVPAAHLSTSVAWLIDDVNLLDELSSGVTVAVRLLTQTNSDVLALEDALIDTLTLTARQGRPYPPGNFKINGNAYPASLAAGRPLTISAAAASSVDPAMPEPSDYVATDTGGEQWLWWQLSTTAVALGTITVTGGTTSGGASLAAMLNGAEVQITTGNPAGSPAWVSTGVTLSGVTDSGAARVFKLPDVSARAVRLYKTNGQVGIPGAALDAGGISFATAPAALSISWSHRDRILEADQLIDTTIGDIGPEPGTTYRLRIYNGGTLIRTYSNITGTSQIYTLADEIANGGFFVSLRVVLDAVRDGLYSTQAHDWTVERG